jgi:mannose-1-phosphate guanylyltransferase/phosphomannomutase
MKAVIMAGGEGTRLRPLTSTQPKPMLPMGDVPMMAHIVRLLERYGFTEIVVTVAYLANSIRTYFGDGSEFGVTMTYVSEDTPLGTAGSVGNARELLREPFLVISGDVLTDIDLGRVWEDHFRAQAAVTVVLQRVENPLDFGIVMVDESGQITRFLEKPSWGEVFTDTVNTGIYVFEPQVFDDIPINGVCDFSSDVFPKLLSDGKRLMGWISDRYWEDVGTLSGYLKAHRDILDGHVDVRVPGFTLREGLYVGEGSFLHPTVEIEEPVFIGVNSRVGARTRLRRYSVIGSNSKIGDDVTIENSILADHCFIGSSSHIRGAIIGRSTDVRRGVVIEDGVVVGDDCYLGDESIVQPFVKIYPSKTVQSRTTVNTSIVWESQGSRTLFDAQGITGLPNVDISPEVAVRVGMAYGSAFPPGSTIVASRDSSRAARMLKRALMVGINAVGVTVVDIELAATPLSRYVTSESGADGGVRVSVSANDPDMVEIRFHAKDGSDLDEAAKRKIERLFQREDFRKVLPSELGDISFPGRVVESYVESLVNMVPLEAIRRRQFRLVTDYSYGSIGALVNTTLSKFDADVLSLNPYAATARMMRTQIEEQRERVQRTVIESSADLGLIFSAGGDRVEVIDDAGNLLYGQNFARAMVELFGAQGGVSHAFVTVDTSNVVVKSARERGMEIVWTQANEVALCHDALSWQGPIDVKREFNPTRGVLGLSPFGALVMPGVVNGTDAIFNVARILGALAEVDLPLSKILGAKEPIHVRSATVHAPSELKGTLMRSLAEDASYAHALLVDGLRVEHDDGGFTLIAPDASEPLMNITVEASSDELVARRLVDFVEAITARLRSL